MMHPDSVFEDQEDQVACGNVDGEIAAESVGLWDVRRTAMPQAGSGGGVASSIDARLALS